MSPPLALRAPESVETPAVRALEGQFQPAALADLAGSAAAAVPARLWQMALLGPARNFLGRPGKQFRAALVEAAYGLGGGRGAPHAHLALLVELVHAGSLIVDDIEDDSAVRRGEPTLHRQVGLPLALNTGNWLYFWPLCLIDGLGLDDGAALALHRRFASAMLRCHQGQALDLSVRLDHVSAAEIGATVTALTRLKTGSLMELAAATGALGAGATTARVDALARFGAELGLGLQMLDDLGSLGGVKDPGKRHEDLRHGNLTWVWAILADTVDPFSFAHFVARARTVREGGGDIERLASDLLAVVNGPGRRRVRQLLDGAFADLRHHVAGEAGAETTLAAIAAGIDRLERSYG